MPPRFDDETSRLSLSVADLLAKELAGSLGFGSRGGYERLWLGQAIHGRYQEAAMARDGSYRREVPLTAEVVQRGWAVTLSGRADGLRREPDGTLIVEEIKSVRRGSGLAPATREAYERQAAVYVWMLRQSHDGEVRAELVLIEIGSDAVERHPVEIDVGRLDSEIRRRLAALIVAHERQRERLGARRELAESLQFPYPRARPGQEEIVAAVEGALERRDHLLLEAPTGLGKTVAVLYPALRQALRHDERVFVLTAKTLQQEMAMTVLDLLNRDRTFHSVRLRAKAKMCANGEVICHEDYCPFARDYFAKVSSTAIVSRLLDDSGTLDPDLIYRQAREAEVCPFEVSLDVAGRSQVVVCDYNYAFDPYVALGDFGPDGDLGNTILVVDEIHNLVERGRDYYSPELSAATARTTAERVGRRGAPIHHEIEEGALELARLIERAIESELPYADRSGRQEQAVETLPPEDELWQLRSRFDALFVDYLEYQREQKAFSADDPFVDLYFSLLRYLNALLLVDDAFSTLVMRTPDDRRLQIVCKDPSRFLGDVIGRTHATIGLSATLSPVEFYRDLLGFDPERTESVRISNPFPERNRRVVIDPSVETTYRQRPVYYGPIADQIAAFARGVTGNAIVLFPSYAFLTAVAERLEVDGKRVLVQQRTDGDAAREEILDLLRNSLYGDVLLLAVAGGVFAEGVDYPGEALSAVAVVGPCLPAVCLERQLLRQYYEERFGRGFEYAYVVPGMTRVVQAAGRLIRSAEDRGVIALLDRRFLVGPYRRHLPDDWLPPSGPEGLVGEPGEVTAEFFASALSRK